MCQIAQPEPRSVLDVAAVRVVGRLIEHAKQRDRAPRWEFQRATLVPATDRTGSDASGIEGDHGSIVVTDHAERFAVVVHDVANDVSSVIGRDRLGRVAFGDEQNVRVSEIWESQEQLQAFGEKLQPKLAAAGIQLAGEPEIFEALNLETF
jgi:hypothetical protein